MSTQNTSVFDPPSVDRHANKNGAQFSYDNLKSFPPPVCSLDTSY